MILMVNVNANAYPSSLGACRVLPACGMTNKTTTIKG